VIGIRQMRGDLVGAAKKAQQRRWLKESFGARLRGIRRANKLTQGMAVLHLNKQITQNDVSKWERGHTSPDPYRLALLLSQYKKINFRLLFDLQPDEQWSKGKPCLLPKCNGSTTHGVERWMDHYRRSRTGGLQ
jgi:Ni/Co efflux regulator RcnB